MATYTRPVPNDANTGPDTTYINGKAIERLEQELLLADACTPGTLPAHAGSTMRWIVDENLQQADESRFDALVGRDTDGSGDIAYGTRSSINERAYKAHYVEKRLNWYGEFVPVRQVDLETMPRGEMDRIAGAVGYSGAEVLNGLVAAQVDGRGNGWNPQQPTASTNVVKAAATLAAGTNASAHDLFTIKGKFREMNVKPFDDGYYRLYMHPTGIVHMQTEVDAAKVVWTEALKYVSGLTGQERIVKGNAGAIGGVMVFETTDITTATIDTVSAFQNIALGKDALGAASLGDMDPQVKIHRSGAQSIDDPYEMFATVAWRLKTAPVKISNFNWPTDQTVVDKRCLLYQAAVATA